MYLILGLGLVSRAGLAQEIEKPMAPVPPGMKAALDRLKGDMLRPESPKLINLGPFPGGPTTGRPQSPRLISLGPLVPVCSVPLIIVQPTDPEPHSMSAPLPQTYTDNMPALIMPAPPCKDLLGAAAK